MTNKQKIINSYNALNNLYVKGAENIKILAAVMSTLEDVVQNMPSEAQDKKGDDNNEH